MKNLLPLLLIGGLLACRTTTADPARRAQSAAATQDIELTYNKSVTIMLGGLAPARATATLADVRDSRCPPNAQCITAGSVEVAISLKEAGSLPQTVRLCLGCDNRGQPGPIDSAAVVLRQRGYWLRLLAVRPAPANPAGSPPPVATLRLRAR